MARILNTLIVGLVFASTTQAQADRVFFGERNGMVYITDAQFPSREIPLALCAHVIDTYAFWIPVKRTALGYGYAESHCSAGAFEPITTETLGLMRDAGVLPADVPDQPAVAHDWAWISLVNLAAAALLILGIPMMLRQRMRHASRQAVGRGQDPMFYDILLSTLYHTARIDGVIEKAEIQAISRSYKLLTAASLTPAMTASKFTEALSDDAILKLAENCNREQASLLMEGAVSVATHAGVVTREKRTFLHQLNNHLGGDPDALRERLEAEMKRPNINVESEIHRTVDVA